MKYLVSVTGIVAVVITGCGGGVEQAQPRRSAPAITGGYGYGGAVAGAEARPADQVQVLEANYYGRRALKMTNGLVTVVAVPELGGRIMEYKIGSKPLLWVNMAELQQAGKAKSGESERVWRNWGGYKVWPAPQERWGGPPDPPGSQLDGGSWVGRIVKPRGEEGQIELVSPADTSVTGLQITRRVTMYKGTTRVKIDETFKNTTSHDIRWSIWAIAQVPGSLSAEERFSQDARIYFPLNPTSRFTGGYRSIISRPSNQWRVLNGGIVEVSYQHELAKIGADSTAGWLAYVDDRHDWAFIQRFNVEPGAEYPDGGCTTEVFTSDNLPYMEAEVLSPLYTIRPGEEATFSLDWYACRVSGPIREVSEIAALHEPPALSRKDSSLLLTGSLGVFAPGTLRVTPLDAAGKATSKPLDKTVSPTEIVSLKETIPAQDKAPARVSVELERDGKPSPIASISVNAEAK
ncbi:MAG: hypothetical protein H5T86_07340, partial [Armatimonadetes bacterium]|nr:hypothetical protein [Armatimonadota bacterium]